MDRRTGTETIGRHQIPRGGLREAPGARPAPPGTGQRLASAGWPLSCGLGPLGALPTAPRLARAFAVLTVGSWGIGAITEFGELIVSELATNVVRAGTGPDGRPRYDTHGRLPLLWLRLMSDMAWLRIEVWDSIPTAHGTPVARRAAPDEESGRGLGLVAALSHDWGWDAVPGNQAKRVWAVLPIPLRLARNGTEVQLAGDVKRLRHWLFGVPVGQMDGAGLDEVKAVEEPGDLLTAAQLAPPEGTQQHPLQPAGLRAGIGESA